ncbi:capsular polysaccharide biosynthesis protein [Rhodopirellula islandica]|uniref:Capsular polysaccharide biosynthesis protein n=1 Tax=Rhodopirellula islandica TaxID=595434 RepID=A0A0J1BBH2_RHOIS|nr:glycosyltransferase [Rhodopirellula islandica]KLU03990.1 capsular polysaccharide biosynthesis protein [Rhodopirellula islandica]
MKMKLACVIHSLDGGGAERVMAGLASRLAGRSHSVTLITLDDGSHDRHKVDSRVSRQSIHVLSTPESPVSLWARTRRLRATIAAGNFDVVLSFCDATNWLTLLATRGLGVPVVVSERSDPKHQSLGRTREFLRRQLYPKAYQVVCLSEDVATTLQSSTRCHTLVIPSAVEAPTNAPTTMRPTSPNEESDPDGKTQQIVAVGRLEHEKGFDRLIRCLAALPGDAPEWQLTIHGEGSQRGSLKSLARELNVDSQVEFPGWTRPIWPAYSNADWFVLPSRYEGFPSALLEAMACSTAVLAVDAAGAVRDVIDHGRNGWLVENNDTALRDGLQHCLASSELRTHLALHAGEVVDRFGWKAMVDAYETCLQEACEGRPRP